MINSQRIAFIGLFFALTITFTIIADENLLTPETVVHLETVSNVAISPEGSKIAYVRRVQRSPEDERGGPYTEMFVIPAAGGEPQQFTARPHNVANLQWSPDGNYIYFRSHRREVHPGMQVYRISLNRYRSYRSVFGNRR